MGLITTILSRGGQSCCYNDNPVINWIMMPKPQPTLTHEPCKTLSRPTHWDREHLSLVFGFLFHFLHSSFLTNKQSVYYCLILLNILSCLVSSLLLPLALPLIQLPLCLICLFTALPANLIIKESWQLKHRYEGDLSFMLAALMRYSFMPLMQLKFN